MAIQVIQKEPLIKKLEEIYERVANLREEVALNVESKVLIEDTATIRSCLDELEKMVFEEYSRECFLAAANNEEDEVNKWLVVLNRLYK